MNLVEYQSNTSRTNADLGSKMLNNVHMVLGLSSELGELIEALGTVPWDEVNIGEELADMCWYISEYCNINEFNLSELSEPEKVDEFGIHGLTIAIGELSNLHKRELAYKKTYEVANQLKITSEVFFYIKELFKDCELNMEQYLGSNIRKLRVRYPDKFDESFAIERRLDDERKELEK